MTSIVGASTITVRNDHRRVGESHPEVEDLDPHRLVAVWMAVVLWFAAKSGTLNQWDRGDIPEQ